MLELADEADSKSVGSDTVRVRPPPPAPIKRKYDHKVVFSLYFCLYGSNPRGFAVKKNSTGYCFLGKAAQTGTVAKQRSASH